jgi:hypothetical protein
MAKRLQKGVSLIDSLGRVAFASFHQNIDRNFEIHFAITLT